MKIVNIICIISALLPYLIFSKILTYKKIIISDEQAHAIAHQIWFNECNKTIDGLTSWNPGEDFASLGIGHFIWYPENPPHQYYHETFPELLNFLQQHDKILPLGILKNGSHHCPWQSRDEFLKNLRSPAMISLRKFLVDTIDLQIKFIINRLEHALPTLLAHTHKSKKAHIRKQFYRVANTPMGIYALIDYINFKGEGIKPQEAYQGKQWGLLQVLDTMQENNLTGVQEFAQAAKKVLKERVAHAPREKNEQRWLPGWEKRINTYLQHNLSEG